MKKFQSSAKKGLSRWLIPVFAFLFLAVVLLFADLWYIRIYGHTNFDSIIFTLTSNLSGSSSTLLWQYILEGLLPAVLVWGAMLALTLMLLRKTGVKTWMASIALCMLGVAALVYAAFDSQLVEYLINIHNGFNIYEDYYQDPDDTLITFPEEKRNLVYIVLESMESTFLSKELGGGVEHNLIPELYDLAKDNINFSEHEGVGGFRQTTGATWTIGSLVAQNGGVPLVPIVSPNETSEDGSFLPGLTTLADILHENGYYQAFMLGSSAAFGDTGLLYSAHGVDKVYDVYTAPNDGIVEPGYWDNWWGMEDYYLFEYAKQELTKIAAQDQPFAFTMMTIDTHHVGGHLCPYCENVYEEQYDNVISCSSRQVAAFVTWLQQQPYYENTTVVIVGDHNSMDNGYFERNVEQNHIRRVYNCFINSAAHTTASKNREFCAIDLFPTTLAAMGCTIEGDRLGLGTNLFSGLPTLLEQWDYETLCARLYGNKDYYAQQFRTKETH